MSDVFISNRKARFDYTVLDDYTAGMALKGLQIKAIRAGKVDISASFCYVTEKGVMMNNVVFDGMQTNDIPLLLTKREIRKLEEAVKLKGNTIIPLNIKIPKNHAKVQIGLCKGKKNWDKRQTIKERDLQRSQ